MNSFQDRIDIQDRLFFYTYLLDTGRANDVPYEIFTEDAIVNYGTEKDLVGRDDIVASFKAYPDVLEATSHNITNVVINVTGNTAKSFARVMGWHWFSTHPHVGKERPVDFLQIAAYEDQWRSENIGWRISKRHIYVVGPGVMGLAAGVNPPWPCRHDSLFGSSPWPY